MIGVLMSGLAMASIDGSNVANMVAPDLTMSFVGLLAVAIFIISYAFVIAEEQTHFRKSKPVMLGGGLIWLIVGVYYANHDISELANQAIKHNLLEYAELFLFLLVAMTYIESIKERKVFDWLKSWILKKNLSLRQIFWLTGVMSFVISPIADNLTTALIMGSIIITVGGSNSKFVTMSLINIVVAANAGGAFSPFGDITTLMVWQKGVVQFSEFFAIFIPSVINFIIPATIMSVFIKNTEIQQENEIVQIRYGGKLMAIAFVATIATAISFHNFLHLPPAMGMMLGLGYLMVIGYFVKKSDKCDKNFDVFERVGGAEWDTLLFFFGIILSIGGLGLMGYLDLMSTTIYANLSPTMANASLGILSAIIDNIPVMFAVLTMNPDLSLNQWLLITLTTGVGGSLLAIGSAAGVALMGIAKGQYTFMQHLKWSPVIFIGYVASIYAHILINGA